MATMNTTRLTPSSPAYPERLLRLHDPPQQLFIRGRLPDFKQPVLAVVGSRKASAYGRWATDHLVGRLAAAGVHILSGLALGIDGLSHLAALERGGLTSAVLPSGLSEVYPASHRGLARRIVESGGALISEYPPATRAAPYHFPARNRLVAALSNAVLVIEAGTQSGTLITAEHALDLGVPVLAVPGPINSPTSAGTHQLLKLGAGLVTGAEDIWQELGVEAGRRPQLKGANAMEDALLESLQRRPAATLEDLAEELRLPPPELNRLLTHLELTGAIRAEAGRWTLA
jgi:DNA processing protein